MGDFGEFASACGIKTKIHDRLVGPLIEARLRVDEIGAGDEHAFLDKIFLPSFAGQNFGIGRAALFRLLRRHGYIDHAEVELGGLAKDFLEPRRILQSRYLNEDAVSTLALNCRLDQSEFVDAALDDLNRLIDRLAHPLGDCGVGGNERNDAATLVDRDGALAGAAGKARKRLRQLTQFRQRCLQIGIACDPYFDAIAADCSTGEGNARLPQHAQHVVIDRLQLLLAHRGRVDFQQKMRTALQIETEHDVALRPARPMPDHIFGKEIRYRAKTHDKSRKQDCRRLPSREKQHEPDFSLTL